MKDLRVLSIQDLSCYGQCSLTVSLPILSACGIETAILPTALLSNHTAGFEGGFSFLSLDAELPEIRRRWQANRLEFDAFVTGYLGKSQWVDDVLSLAREFKKENGPFIVDPAFGDNGKLYPGFDQAYVDSFKALVEASDVFLPNLTEACLLLGKPYRPDLSEKEIMDLLSGLKELGAKSVVLKGAAFKEGLTGVYVLDENGIQSYFHEKLPYNYHGTGDVFASAFAGAYLQGKSKLEAVRIACDFVVESMKETVSDPAHSYGVKFEKKLPLLLSMLRK